ncbi:MAG: permease-like cell division protein FtsX [Oscillospiraceae bacterium]|jgi:cell division transport system permease protein|nr:permease-like cell division protein FtsX [Oscillospiraceae bacterium]
MKLNLNSFVYLIKEGFKSIWNNWIISLATTVVLICCLVLTGSTVLLSNSANKILDKIKSQNTITAYLTKDFHEEDYKKIEKKINDIPNVTNVEFCSKDQQIEKYSSKIGKDFVDVLKENNPLRDSYIIKVKDLNKYDETADTIYALQGVEPPLINTKDTVKKVSNFINIICTIKILLIVAFAFLALFIISNTIKITMYGRRLEISIMKSVGATNLFIRVPFIVEGIVIGVISSLISLGVLKILSDIILNLLRKMLQLMPISFEGVDTAMVVCFVLAGFFSGFIGGVISIRKYLHKEGGEVVAL